MNQKTLQGFSDVLDDGLHIRNMYLTFINCWKKTYPLQYTNKILEPYAPVKLFWGMGRNNFTGALVIEMYITHHDGDDDDNMIKKLTKLD